MVNICITSCEKPNNAVADPNNIPGLPPATQSGANTFGCLVNGVPWVPAGSNGTSNLSIDYDPGINNGIFNIDAMNTLSASLFSRVWIGIDDSLNILDAPFTINSIKGSIAFIKFSKNGNCILRSFDNDAISSGRITIKKHDRINRILSGSFEGSISKMGCDTVTISNGRFDFKF